VPDGNLSLATFRSMSFKATPTFEAQGKRRAASQCFPEIFPHTFVLAEFTLKGT
jgi:hypothetical protein